jgi:hypothetical protein
MSSPYKPALDWHFMSDSGQRPFCHLFTYSTYLEANLAGPDSGDPKFRFTFAFAHSCFQGLGAYRLMRKNPYIDLAFTMQKMGRRYTAGFNVLGAYPAAFQGLQAVLAKRHIIASGRVALHPAALAFTVFNSFRHRCHLLYPWRKHI